MVEDNPAIIIDAFLQAFPFTDQNHDGFRLVVRIDSATIEDIISLNALQKGMQESYLFTSL